MSDKKKIDSLDFIRAASVLMIIMFHFMTSVVRSGGDWKDYSLFAPMGSIGVSFFIIISGAGLFISSKNWNGSIEFYIKRFKSIYPTFWFVYFFMTCFLFLFMGRVYVGDSIDKWLLTISGFDGYMSWYTSTYYLVGEWFIGFIVLIYILFPLLRLALNRNRTATLISSVVAAIIMNNFNGEISTALPIFNANAVWNPIVRLPEFIFGAIMAEELTNKSKSIKYIASVSFVYLIIATSSFDNLNMGALSIPSTCALFCVIVFLYEKLRIKKEIISIISFFSSLSFVAFLIHHKIIGTLSSYLKINYHNEIAVYIYMFTVIFTVFTLAYFVSKPLKHINACFK
ncbi:acyltransferase [Enterobacter hormaechei]